MALFEYFAISSNGRKFKSIISSDSLDEAKIVLHSKAIVVYKIEVFKKKIKALSKKQTLYFLEHLKNLIESGLPIYESLSAIADSEYNKNLKYMILDISEEIKFGNNLSFGLKKHDFDFVICSIIENAQKTANLNNALEEITQNLKNELDLKKKIVSSFSYPAVLLAFSFVILTALFFYIIPSLFDLFENKNLHPFTKAIVSISSFLCSNKLLVLISFLSLILILFLAFTVPKVKYYLYEKVLILPFLKPLMIKLSLIRFFKSFSYLLIGGQSYVSSLNLASKLLRHPLLEKEILPMEEKLVQGQALSSLMMDKKHIPKIIPSMICIAEQSSTMPKVLLNISKIFEEDVKKTIQRFTTFLQPMLLILLGIIIAFVVLSVLLPLTDISSFIGD